MNPHPIAYAHATAFLLKHRVWTEAELVAAFEVAIAEALAEPCAPLWIPLALHSKVIAEKDAEIERLRERMSRAADRIEPLIRMGLCSPGEAEALTILRHG